MQHPCAPTRDVIAFLLHYLCLNSSNQDPTSRPCHPQRWRNQHNTLARLHQLRVHPPSQHPLDHSSITPSHATPSRLAVSLIDRHHPTPTSRLRLLRLCLAVPPTRRRRHHEQRCHPPDHLRERELPSWSPWWSTAVRPYQITA